MGMDFTRLRPAHPGRLYGSPVRAVASSTDVSGDTVPPRLPGWGGALPHQTALPWPYFHHSHLVEAKRSFSRLWYVSSRQNGRLHHFAHVHAHELFVQAK